MRGSARFNFWFSQRWLAKRLHLGEPASDSAKRARNCDIRRPIELRNEINILWWICMCSILEGFMRCPGRLRTEADGEKHFRCRLSEKCTYLYMEVVMRDDATTVRSEMGTRLEWVIRLSYVICKLRHGSRTHRRPSDGKGLVRLFFHGDTKKTVYRQCLEPISDWSVLLIVNHISEWESAFSSWKMAFLLPRNFGGSLVKRA